MLSAEMGYLGNYNRHKESPFERFEVGGDGMSGYNIYGIDIISMRGYEDGALDPTSNYSRGYNKYTAELRYPVILKPSSTIYALVFLEGGNAFDSWKSFSPFKIKRSAGVGVRLFLPVVGMLGIDWGYGFDHPEPGQHGPSQRQPVPLRDRPAVLMRGSRRPRGATDRRRDARKRHVRGRSGCPAESENPLKAAETEQCGNKIGNKCVFLTDKTFASMKRFF